jgi:single stranded DNA-binding protein
MNDPDPAIAANLDDLASCLKYIHLLADRPAYRTLEQQTAREGGFLPGTRLKRVKLTRSTVSDVLIGRKFPGKAFLLTFVDACGVNLEHDRRWEQAWDRLAVQYQQALPLEETERLRQEEVERLRQESEELRQQLTAAKRQAEAEEAGHRIAQAMKETPLTVVGDLVDDPELRFTLAGLAIARFRIASTPEFYDKQSDSWEDGGSLFLTVNVWRQLAEDVAESLHRGTRVIVTGRLRQRSYETKEGEKRTVYEVEADEVSLSLKAQATNETQLTIAGDLIDDPELRFTPAGQPVARFHIASTPRYRDNATGEWKDGEILSLTCNVWRQLAEDVAESLHRGTRVIVTGRLRQRSYETKEGEKRTVYEIEVDEVGPSLLNGGDSSQNDEPPF